MVERHRKLNRWEKYDYSMAGCYFVTICIKDKLCLLGEIEERTVFLNNYGEIINNAWKNIPNYYDNVILDEHVIMPNHIHGIIIIRSTLVGTEHRSVPNCSDLKRSIPRDVNVKNIGLLSKIIRSFKESCVKTIRMKYQDYAFAFQRSFHDHIIRNEKSLYAIRQYIKDNPQNWLINDDNPANWK